MGLLVTAVKKIKALEGTRKTPADRFSALLSVPASLRFYRLHLKMNGSVCPSSSKHWEELAYN